MGEPCQARQANPTGFAPRWLVGDLLAVWRGEIAKKDGRRRAHDANARRVLPNCHHDRVTHHGTSAQTAAEERQPLTGTDAIVPPLIDHHQPAGRAHHLAVAAEEDSRRVAVVGSARGLGQPSRFRPERHQHVAGPQLAARSITTARAPAAVAVAICTTPTVCSAFTLPSRGRK